MKLKTNSIITIDTKERYLVLNKTEVRNKTSFLVMGIDENNNTIASKVAIFEEDASGEDIFVTKVEDKEIISSVMKKLKEEMQK